MRRSFPLIFSILMGISGFAFARQEGGENNRRPTPMPRATTPSGQPMFFRRSQASELDRAMERHDSSFATPLPRRPAAAPRVTRVDLYPGTRTVIPCGWDRAILMPDQAFWGRRDLMADIQLMSRAGFIPATPVPLDAVELSGVADYPAGWKAYAMAVPPKGQVTVRVSHSKPAWFRIIMSNKWSSREEGMLRPVGEPLFGMLSRTYANPSNSPKAIYIIVDDPGWWSTKQDPYTIAFERSWDPATTDLSGVKLAAGIWGAQPSVSAEFRHPSVQAVGH